MSSALVLVIRCDHAKCKRTCGGVPGVYKDIWRNAKAEGWIHQKDYSDDSIGRDTHYCPKHAEKHE